MKHIFQKRHFQEKRLLHFGTPENLAASENNESNDAQSQESEKVQDAINSTAEAPKEGEQRLAEARATEAQLKTSTKKALDGAKKVEKDDLKTREEKTKANQTPEAGDAAPESTEKPDAPEKTENPEAADKREAADIAEDANEELADLTTERPPRNPAEADARINKATETMKNVGAKIGEVIANFLKVLTPLIKEFGKIMRSIREAFDDVKAQINYDPAKESKNDSMINKQIKDPEAPDELITKYKKTTIDDIKAIDKVDESKVAGMQTGIDDLKAEKKKLLGEAKTTGERKKTEKEYDGYIEEEQTKLDALTKKIEEGKKRRPILIARLEAINKRFGLKPDDGLKKPATNVEVSDETPAGEEADKKPEDAAADSKPAAATAEQSESSGDSEDAAKEKEKSSTEGDSSTETTPSSSSGSSSEEKTSES